MLIKEQLTACFGKPLPGLAAQLEMAPLYRRDEMLKQSEYKCALKSSVLILFYEKYGEYYLPFIRRPKYQGVHSGQIAFPGGRWETTDKSLYHTALREAREEIGIKPELAGFSGKLTDLYIPPSNYIVSPFTATYKPDGPFVPDPTEVAQILEIPFSFFLHPSSVKMTTLKIASGHEIETPCFEFQGDVIWGATAMIMNELIILWKTTVKYR